MMRVSPRLANPCASTARAISVAYPVPQDANGSRYAISKSLESAAETARSRRRNARRRAGSRAASHSPGARVRDHALERAARIPRACVPRGRWRDSASRDRPNPSRRDRRGRRRQTAAAACAVWRARSPRQIRVVRREQAQPLVVVAAPAAVAQPAFMQHALRRVVAGMRDADDAVRGRDRRSRSRASRSRPRWRSPGPTLRAAAGSRSRCRRLLPAYLSENQPMNAPVSRRVACHDAEAGIQRGSSAATRAHRRRAISSRVDGLPSPMYCITRGSLSSAIQIVDVAAARTRAGRAAASASHGAGAHHVAPRPRAPRAARPGTPAASACVISSRSPSMIASILYSVRLIRWSVTRPCGKL